MDLLLGGRFRRLDLGVSMLSSSWLVVASMAPSPAAMSPSCTTTRLALPVPVRGRAHPSSCCRGLWHKGPSGGPGVGDGTEQAARAAARRLALSPAEAKPMLDCSLWDAARQPAGGVQAIDKKLEGVATMLMRSANLVSVR
jgi:hypothetical protein